MTWNEDQKYRREWDNGSVYPSLLHSTRQTGRDGKVSTPIQSPSHNERTPLTRSGPVGYRRRRPLIPTLLPRGMISTTQHVIGTPSLLLNGLICSLCSSRMYFDSMIGWRLPLLPRMALWRSRLLRLSAMLRCGLGSRNSSVNSSHLSYN